MIKETIEDSSVYNYKTKNRKTRFRIDRITSHFILESGGLICSQQNSFGPYSSDLFSTTSKITFSGTKTVHAACNGRIFIQPNNSNPDLVNIALKPSKSSFGSFKVLYFIYRGLNKSDFFSGENISGSEESGTEFVKSLWKNFNSFYQNISETSIPFKAEMIGFPGINNPQLDTTVQIASYFNKNTVIINTSNSPQEESSFAFELPFVKAGMEIGTASEELGIDIVLDEGSHYISSDPFSTKINLSFIRSEKHELDLTSVTDAYQKRCIRESIRSFIDYTAFCGHHVNGKLYVDQNLNPLTESSEILNLLDNFSTKNNIYIYIQSNRSRSYNFYENYPNPNNSVNDLLIGAHNSTLSETNYTSNSWPVYIYTSNSSADSKIDLALLSDYDERNSFLVIKSGFLDESYEYSNQVLRTHLNSAENISGVNYTDKIIFQLLKDQLSGEHLAQIISIIYFGKQLIPPPFGLEEDPLKFLSKSLFLELFTTPFVASPQEDGNFKILTDQINTIGFTNELSAVNRSKIILSKTIFDQASQQINNSSELVNRVLFVSELSYSAFDHHNYDICTNLLGEDSTSFSEKKCQYIYGAGGFKISKLAIQEENNFYCLQLINNSGIPNSFFQVGITLFELNNLLQLAPSGISKESCKLYLEFVDETIVNIVAGLGVLKYKLGICYENQTGTLVTAFGNEPLFIFGIQSDFLCSTAFSICD